MRKKTLSKLPKIRIPSAKAEDQPATRKMLRWVRDELKSEIRALDRKMEARFLEQDARFAARFTGIDTKFDAIDARFNAIDARFVGIDTKFDAIDARFNAIDARFAGIDARFEEIRADNARTHLLLEEQNANNRIVLEGLQALWQRQDRIEKDLNRL